MYCAYSYNAGLTAANLLSDVVKLLTGTTDVNDLSAGCDKTRTDIKSVEPAGWTIYDNDAAVLIANNRTVLRAPVFDNPNLYKYVMIEANTAGANGLLYIKGYEAWNAVTHTGTNECQFSANQAYATRFDKVNKGRIDMRATVRCILTTNIGPNLINSTNGNAQGIVEFTRGADWDTIANAYPNFGYAVLGYTTIASLGSPRALGPNEKTDVTSSSSYKTTMITSAEATNNSTANLVSTNRIETATADKMLAIPFFVFGYTNINNGYVGGGEVSSLNGIYVTIVRCLLLSKIIDSNGQAYIIWPGYVNYTSLKFAVKYA